MIIERTPDYANALAKDLMGAIQEIYVHHVVRLDDQRQDAIRRFCSRDVALTSKYLLQLNLGLVKLAVLATHLREAAVNPKYAAKFWIEHAAN